MCLGDVYLNNASLYINILYNICQLVFCCQDTACCTKLELRYQRLIVKMRYSCYKLDMVNLTQQQQIISSQFAAA